MDLVVVYDVSTAERGGQKRLAKVAATCERYGFRVQNSVFECRLSGPQFVRMKAELREIVKPSEDSVMIYRFPGDVLEWRESLGRPPIQELGDPWVF